MGDAKPYSLAIRNLMYTIVCTRLDIAHAINIVGKFLSNLGNDNWEVVKQIIKYGKSKLCLCFGGANPILEGYTLHQIWQEV